MLVRTDSKVEVWLEDFDPRTENTTELYLFLKKGEEFVGIYALRMLNKSELGEKLQMRVPNEEIQQWINEYPMDRDWSFSTLVDWFVYLNANNAWLLDFKPYM